MNFSLPAGRFARHAWEDQPIRERGETRPANDFKMRPWWAAGAFESDGSMDANRIAHFGELVPAEDGLMELMRCIDVGSHMSRVADIEHEFASEAHAARVGHLAEVGGQLRIRNPKTGGLLTPTLYGTTPSTRAPMEAYVAAVNAIDAERGRRLRAVEEAEGRPIRESRLVLRREAAAPL